MTKAQRIRDVLKEKGVLVMPGVYDCLSTKIASRAGFDVIFITGYSVSATLLGEPDFGLLTQTDLLAASQRICSVTDLPVIVVNRYGERRSGTIASSASSAGAESGILRLLALVLSFATLASV